MPTTGATIDYEAMWTHLRDALAAKLKANDAPEQLRQLPPEQLVVYALTIQNIHAQMELMEQTATDAVNQVNQAQQQPDPLQP